MDYGSGYGTGAQFLGFFVVLYAVVVGFSLLLAVAVYIVNGIAFMRLFRKVGVEPWAAWVPVFFSWRLLELGGQPGWLSILSVVPGANYVTAVFLGISSYKVSVAFRKDGVWVVLYLFLPFVWAFLLASEREHYEPEIMRLRGWAPPLVGYGSARGPYVPGAQAPPAAG